MFSMSERIRFIGIIPARYASLRFPGKPLVNIRGKMMIQHVYERASKVLEHVYVATDDERIYKAVKTFGGHVVMTSANHRSGTDRCAEAVESIEKEKGCVYDVVVNVQGDEPFINPEQIKLLKDCFNHDPQPEIATLVKEITTQEDMINPNRPKVVINNRNEAIYFSRTPIPYVQSEKPDNWIHTHKFYMHIGLYGFRKDVLFEITKLSSSLLEEAESLEQLRWIENGYTIHVRVTQYESLGVDTPDDLEKLLNG